MSVTQSVIRTETPCLFVKSGNVSVSIGYALASWSHRLVDTHRLKESYDAFLLSDVDSAVGSLTNGCRDGCGSILDAAMVRAILLHLSQKADHIPR
jgi:hypothetical protein